MFSAPPFRILVNPFLCALIFRKYTFTYYALYILLKRARFKKKIQLLKNNLMILLKKNLNNCFINKINKVSKYAALKIEKQISLFS